MQQRLSDGYFMISGTCTRAPELRYVGEKQSAMTKFSLAVGKNQDTTTKYANCICWRAVAVHASHIQKGDPVTAFGTIQTREYNGKEYNDFVCESIIFPENREPNANALQERSSSSNNKGLAAAVAANIEGDDDF